MDKARETRERAWKLALKTYYSLLEESAKRVRKMRTPDAGTRKALNAQLRRIDTLGHKLLDRMDKLRK